MAAYCPEQHTHTNTENHRFRHDLYDPSKLSERALLCVVKGKENWKNVCYMPETYCYVHFFIIHSNILKFTGIYSTVLLFCFRGKPKNIVVFFLNFLHIARTSLFLSLYAGISITPFSVNFFRLFLFHIRPFHSNTDHIDKINNNKYHYENCKGVFSFVFCSISIQCNIFHIYRMFQVYRMGFYSKIKTSLSIFSKEIFIQFRQSVQYILL